jgi:hypothetical protein
LFSLSLVRGSGADGGIEGDVARTLVGWTGLDVAAALLIGAGAGASAGLAPGEAVYLAFNAPGDE